jgi:hypothetical protein
VDIGGAQVHAMFFTAFLLSMARVCGHLGDTEAWIAEKLVHDVGDSLDPHLVDRADRRPR